ncbi:MULTISPECIES: DHA2 family efflux MFS transporter permease subunit [Rhodococcus]|uniref:DHA2 family efflux MFS transporter permease subunit n=1 Tax=Rhodococcus oxybenzonivorans TaxID=1990687 RepID=A0AAE4V3X6_9NOCA|nr:MULTISPECIES: DHA2 family efflux MFS transporter permease subunit [Rhodococcus]MDV7245065.1 DHA2 family efflux MFS transporter permease subunit [Rhodococcus oxybenzonivorans]MDV7267962.1 DHA2 family efflux MFS transporter permease subunit [Rhodococcus oxybenzonivorans]MDV7272652.1 DHA2 family efflux MFS transporter permease subunit [Rhodococcus oxybenzonivorans]MDV7336090.1 DHA2 family efflux MFS transporter permease subunit [Rhodococcus oxybenzonivorans]MDV7342777.1 DHA2 family efflux MFS 
MTSPNAAPAVPDKLDGTVLKIASVVVLGAIMSILDVTVVSVALPTFATEFDSTYATVAWTMTGYTLALATVIPLTGWAADRFGTKRLYMTALILFVLGSVLCSFALDITTLIGFRVLQGLGGGMLMPLGMTIMTRAAGPDRVGRVMAVLGIPMLLGPIGGPILGGWLIEAASWHWIFLINLPIGVVALAAAFIILPSDKPSPSESFDFLGMLLLSPGLALFLFGVSSIPEVGTVASARVLVSGAIGLVLIIAFVFHALRKDHPLIDLRLFKNRQLSVAVITTSLFIVAFMGAGLLFPSYFIQVGGHSTLAAGLLMAPQGIGAMLTMPVAGRLVDKIGPGKIVLTGLPLILVGLGVFTQVAGDSPAWLLMGALFVMGLGMGCTMMPLMTAAIVTLSNEQVARGSSLMNIVQQTAGSIGTAVMSVVLTNQLLDRGLDNQTVAMQHVPEVAAQQPPGAVDSILNAAAEAFGNTFMVATVLIAVTLIPAFLLPRKKTVNPSLEAEDVPQIMMH